MSGLDIDVADMVSRDKLELQEIYEKQIRAPFSDALTGLFNYGFFSMYLDKEIQRAKRSGEKFTLCLVDIDEFSIFNRKHGEVKGDLALKRVGMLFSRYIRGSDICARLYSDLFAVIITATGTDAALTAMERLRHEVERGMGGSLTVSAGLATYPEHGSDKKSLMETARNALTTAKIKGGNRTLACRPSKKPVPTAKNRVLVVDDEELNLKLFEAFLESQGYEVITAANGLRALSIIEKTEIDLVLLDVMMPELDGFRVCRTLKSREDTRLIPVILVTAMHDLDAKVRGIEAGADDFISKPPNKFELTTRIKSLIRTRNLNKNLTSIENVLISLANAVEAKDSYTQGHIERVSYMALEVGKHLEIPGEDIEALRMGCILHDVGKISVPRSVLNKPGKLNGKEWEMLKMHPVTGYKICLPLKKTLGAALEVIRHHHEKLDGTGYPDGLSGDEIPILARIAAIVDIYDALTTDRPYRKAISREKALDIMLGEASRGKIDNGILKEFIKVTENRRQDLRGEAKCL